MGMGAGVVNEHRIEQKEGENGIHRNNYEKFYTLNKTRNTQEINIHAVYRQTSMDT